MNQVGAETFEVEPEELVTMVWAGVQGTKGRIDMSLDGRPLLPELEDLPTFSFRVSRGIGDRHLLLIRARFAHEAPADLLFESVVTGSRRGQFDGPTLRRSSGASETRTVVTFHVIANAPGFGRAASRA